MVMSVVAAVAGLAAAVILAAAVAWFRLRQKHTTGLWLLQVPLVVSSYLAKALTPNIASSLLLGLRESLCSDRAPYFIHSFIHSLIDF